METTYIMIKPDGVQRGLINEVIKRFEQKGFYLRGMKLMNVSKSHAETHYSDLSDKCGTSNLFVLPHILHIYTAKCNLSLFCVQAVPHVCKGSVIASLWTFGSVGNPIRPPNSYSCTQALLRPTCGLHCFWASACHGLGGQGRCSDWPQDHRCDIPAGRTFSRMR